MRILFYPQLSSATTDIIGNLKTLGLTKNVQFPVDRNGQFESSYEVPFFQEIASDITLKSTDEYQGLAGFNPEVCSFHNFT